MTPGIKLGLLILLAGVPALPTAAQAQFWGAPPPGADSDDGYDYGPGPDGYDEPRRPSRPAPRRTYGPNDLRALSGGPRETAPPLDGQYIGGGYYGGGMASLPDDSMIESTEQEIAPQFRRQTVAYPGRHGAGTVVIDTRRKYLYLVQGDGTAVRYGIGVGREGFQWRGVQTVSAKREWPDWRPPAEMRKRRPDLPVHMEGGPENPLGARALYLGSSLYRIHGTNEPNTIGHNVSSGCIRLTNEDVVDLYSRVGVGTRVVVL
ncbi:L,D-transpeptidase [Chelatococcus reniformis]|uniref:L,D-TPase catalytic domain-containing protein n=1 Tax=Chelatococcus reniformis TaxID=1494448 RepID=A0A916XLI0_9HYPH|nr:L,D-transpeptidase [Chelatococcus reniformis]GGC83914.1 hypothetical protein GCM10010994_47240 [Chelatococcus reniformis]